MYEVGMTVGGLLLVGEPYKVQTGKKPTKYAKFKCPHCTKEFDTDIYHVKTHNTQSCGCLHKSWTDDKINFLKDNFGKIGTDEIAEKIGKTRKAVWHKLLELGLRRANHSIGDKFGKLTIIGEPFFKKKYGQQKQYALCRCECGKEKEYLLTSLNQGNTKACGCTKGVRGENNHFYKHGKSHSRLMRIWNNMIGRCTNIKNTHFEFYGGRGIIICQEWLEFKNFLDWAESNGYSDDLSIDRIDVDGNYEPSNCRWATKLEQARNKQNTVWIKAFGEEKTLGQWIEAGTCPYTDLAVYKYRIMRGWTSEEALTRPSQKGRANYENLTEEQIDFVLYNRWKSMVHRCNNPKMNGYHNYGGRGIKVYPEWTEYRIFREWAYSNNYDPKLTLDRIDVNGDYCPQNCRWSTVEEQVVNKRTTKLITAWGESKHLAAWVRDERSKVTDYNMIVNRIKAGWSPEEAISTPKNGRRDIKCPSTA